MPRQDLLLSINAEYERLYRRVRSALDGMTDIPAEVRRFTPDRHELSVLQALEWLLAGSHEPFCRYALLPGAPRDVAPIDSATFSHFAEQAAQSERTLRWALLLHDVAKGRGLSGPHPEHCARITAQILSHFGDLDEQDKQVITWLVRYHDVLGNIHSGERSPSFLLDITRDCTPAERQRRLRLLQLVTLCDVRGTEDGAYLTEQRARFWLTLSDETQIRQCQDNLLRWRAERWTGGLAGDTNAQAADALLAKILGQENGDLSRLVTAAFGSRISYIVYGFYLFTALTVDQLATLTKLVARAVDCLDEKQLTLVFETVYRPGTTGAQAALRHYTHQLDQDTLRLTAGSGVEGAFRTLLGYGAWA
jgi:hypothetical protein